MPNYDQTGPQGQGKMTGRGLGPCRQGRGLGLRRCAGGRCCGYGRGLGKYFGWNAPQTKEEQIEDLKTYQQSLREELEDVEKELSSIK